MPPPAQVQNVVENGRTYRIIIEKATHQHPEGSVVGVYTGERYREKVWLHTAGEFESDTDLSRQALDKIKLHAHAR